MRDTGIGIAADQLGDVFEQFVQIDNSLTRRTGGTGLGLAITKQLVELLGGDITVDEHAGRGQRLRLLDPRPAARGGRAGSERRAGAGRRPGGCRRCGCCSPRTMRPTSI